MDILGKLSLSICAMSIAMASTTVLAYEPGQGYLLGTIGQTESIADVIYDDALSLKIGMGYQFAPKVGVELSYLSLGAYEATGAFLSALSQFAGETVTKSDLTFSGFDLSVVGNIPLNEQSKVFGRVGMFVWDATLDFEVSTSDGDFSGDEDVDDGSNINYGVGFLHSFNERFSFRAEYGNYAISLDGTDEDVNNLSLGVNYLFQ